MKTQCPIAGFEDGRDKVTRNASGDKELREYSS